MDAVSFSKRIAEYERPRVGGTCTVCRALVSLDKADADALNAAMDDVTISNSGLAQIMRDEGIPIAETTVRRHRKKQCKGYS